MAVRFEELGLIEPLVKAVAAEGYSEPTPIQQRAIPHVLAGKDLLGLAQTGTGKTAAFALPILQRLHEKGYRPHGDRPIRVLVLTPTRELATQIGDSFAVYGKFLGYKHAVIFGGVGQRDQERVLRAGLDVLVATPGRLLDLAGQRLVHLQHLDVFVLDEADRMLDMGFVHDVRKVIALLPPKRQTLFFSATMPPEAQRLADVLLKDPETVAVAPRSSTAERITQSVYFVEKTQKRALLVEVLKDAAMKRVLVFTRTKHAANRVAEYLHRAGVGAMAIHGNKSQNARERALGGFKEGSTRVLVATDIAARGIDVEEVTHVVNFDLPNVPETYVHRIGRTARAGASGIAISFCDGEEREFLRDIQRLTKITIPVATTPPLSAERGPAPMDRERRIAPPMARPRSEGGGGGGGGRGPVGRDGARPHAHSGRPHGAGGHGGGRPSGRTEGERQRQQQQSRSAPIGQSQPRAPEARAGGGGGFGGGAEADAPRDIWGGGGGGERPAASGGAQAGGGAGGAGRRRRGRRGGRGGGPRF